MYGGMLLLDHPLLTETIRWVPLLVGLSHLIPRRVREHAKAIAIVTFII